MKSIYDQETGYKDPANPRYDVKPVLFGYEAVAFAVRDTLLDTRREYGNEWEAKQVRDWLNSRNQGRY